MTLDQVPVRLLFETPTAVVRTAYLVASWAHRGQRRKDGSAYIGHPLDVAELVTAWVGFDRPELTAAAFLHDVLEDTDITDLTGFPARTIELVELMTKRPGRLDYWKRLWDDPDGRLLKAADRLANLATALLPDRSFACWYARTTRRDMASWLADPMFGPLLLAAVEQCELHGAATA